ncbi:MAG: class I SAM-dependent methyltransferase [Methylococcales bacterium]
MTILSDSHIPFLEESGANLYFLDLIQQMTTGQNGRRFLDIGCGTGILAQSLSLATGMKAYGTEMSLVAYQIASKSIDCTFVNDMLLPYDNAYFDLVIAKDVLPMIPDKAHGFK